MPESSGKNTVERAREIIQQEAEGILSLLEQMNHSLEQAVEMLAGCSGHVLVTGTGTSRFVAQRFSHLLCCCGVPSLFINAADSLHGGAGAITPNDVIFVISKGGRSSEINHFAEIAKARGAKVIALSEKTDSPLAETVDLVLQVIAPGDVDPYGMIATGSSLANSAICDALCVLLLEKKGYTKEKFGETHPGGAVGKKLKQEMV
ncbi:MAG: SIS domain-containing protein [bacterium]